MYMSSAATDTLQGQAMQRINTRWGDDGSQPRGRESLAGPVCKKKYKPFMFRLVQVPNDGDEADALLEQRNDLTSTINAGKSSTSSPLLVTWQVHVERLYGCACHHEIRRQSILRFGERPGWEPFGQWSLKKALQRAKQETARLNALATSVLDHGGALVAVNGNADDVDDESTEALTVSVGRGGFKKKATPATTAMKLLPLCSNGDCLWKVKTAYDDINEEIQELQENESSS